MGRSSCHLHSSCPQTEDERPPVMQMSQRFLRYLHPETLAWKTGWTALTKSTTPGVKKGKNQLSVFRGPQSQFLTQVDVSLSPSSFTFLSRTSQNCPLLTSLLTWNNEITALLTLHLFLFFPGCSLGNGNQTLGHFHLFSHSRNTETKIHTSLLPLYSWKKN